MSSNNKTSIMNKLIRSRRTIGKIALVAIAIGYTGFFAVTLMKPQVFNVGDRKGETPAFVATTPATARLPELIAPPTAADLAAPVSQDETASSVPVVEAQPSAVAAAPEPAVETKPVTSIENHSAAKFRKKRSDSINDDLGMDILQAADETIADASNMRKEMSDSVLKSLGISKRQYATIKMRERRLAQKLRDADDRGSDGFKTLLKTDHSDWMKEYLGPVRYQRFMELAGNT